MKDKKNTGKQTQATWGGRFSQAPSRLMLEFGESVSFDSALAEFDIQGSIAHAHMLADVGIIEKSEYSQIKAGLEKILKLIRAGEFEWKTELEDVHMNIEQALTSMVPCAAKLHTARSRNDQVATDMRLFFKFAADDMQKRLKKLMASLLDLAKKNISVCIPGYTHMQRAQPVSAAHHILAWCEMLYRDIERFKFVYDGANVSPLGSGAIAGTTLPIDRALSAKYMGFVDEDGDPILTGNSMDAVADRDVFFEFAFACATMGVHFSRIAEDVIIWNTSEFAFVKLPDAFTTGSSLMPQKKNPDSFELMRGKSARMIGNLTALMTLVKGLPLTYNRDLQEDKPPIFDSFRQARMCIDVLNACAKEIKFNEKKCAEAVGDPLLLATDLADYFVRRGVPFRKAHHMVGEIVALSEKTATPINKLSDEQVFAICPEASSDWRDVFDLKRAFAMRKGVGMPNPELIAEQIKNFSQLIKQ